MMKASISQIQTNTRAKEPFSAITTDQLRERVRVSMASWILVCFIFGWFELSNSAVYKVGDSAGWTTIGNVDYKHWAAPKTFQLGDIIVFEYNPQFHNVMQVIHSEYKACNASSPISTHTTGNDSITIDTHGHHFFICGVPGHCQAGQKVDINVLRSTSLAPAPTVVPAPSPSAAPILHFSLMLCFSCIMLLPKM